MKDAKITHKLIKTILCVLSILCIFAIPHNSTALVLPAPECSLSDPPPAAGTYAYYSYTDSTSSIGKRDCITSPETAAIIQYYLGDPYPQRQATAPLPGPLRVSAWVGDMLGATPGGPIVERASTEAGRWNTYFVNGPGVETTLKLTFTIDGTLFVGNYYAISGISLIAYVLDYPSYAVNVESTWNRSFLCEPDPDPNGGTLCALNDDMGMLEEFFDPEYTFNNEKIELFLTVPVGELFGLHFTLFATSAFSGGPADPDESGSDFFESLEFGHTDDQGVSTDLFVFPDDPNAYSIEVYEEGQNQAPEANAGPDRETLVNEPIQMDGTAEDPDGDTIVSWLWTVEQEPSPGAAALEDADLPNALFRGSVAGEYVLSLVVNDGTDDSLPDYITITVTEPTSQTPQEMIGDLIDEIQGYIESGLLTSFQGNRLIALLNRALKSLNNGYTRLTEFRLNRFVNIVSRYINRGKLPETEGQALINAANEIIEAI